ncbi:MAG TPA: hypothetical protein VGG02_10490 [Chthoniobacterales bacterium]|jgi:hypothetical protein
MTDNTIAQQEKASSDASPAKSLMSDLAGLRRALRLTGRSYLRRLEMEIDEITLWAKRQTNDTKLPKSAIRDLGDMITLVRKVEIKPRKGRRRDLRKIDATVSDLRDFLKPRDHH